MDFFDCRIVGFGKFGFYNQSKYCGIFLVDVSGISSAPGVLSLSFETELKILKIAPKLREKLMTMVFEACWFLNVMSVVWVSRSKFVGTIVMILRI